MSHAKLINLRFNNFFKHPSGTEDQSVCFVLSLFLLFDRKNSEQVTENFFRKSLQKRAQRITKTSLNVDQIIFFLLLLTVLTVCLCFGIDWRRMDVARVAARHTLTLQPGRAPSQIVQFTKGKRLPITFTCKRQCMYYNPHGAFSFIVWCAIEP